MVPTEESSIWCIPAVFNSRIMTQFYDCNYNTAVIHEQVSQVTLLL